MPAQNSNKKMRVIIGERGAGKRELTNEATFDEMMNAKTKRAMERPSVNEIDLHLTIYGNKTGREGSSLEIRIPLEVRRIVPIDENTPLHVKIDTQKNRLILEVGKPELLSISRDKSQKGRSSAT